MFAKEGHRIRGCIEKFPDRVVMKYILTFSITGREATQRAMTAKLTRLTHSDTAEPSDRELYHLQFSLLEASPETF
jgi:hypothetical protein